MKIEDLWLILSLLKCCFILTKASNKPPRFLAGGDMAHFSIAEDIPVGSTIYKLRGTDPEGGSVFYSISGAYFTVNKSSGDVILTRELDREVIDTLEVIISITDEPVLDSEPNMVSLRREIPIIDVNDNYPTFNSTLYEFSVAEDTKVGTRLFSGISIYDRDFGINSLISLFCVQSVDCQIFTVFSEKRSDGNYKGGISLAQPLNYEQQSSYTLWLEAVDSNPKKPLSSTTKVVIDVEDVQDQPPVFFNTPYSITVLENTKPDQKLLTVEAKDGDVKNLRPVTFSVEQDILNYFAVQNLGNGNATIYTTENPVDREHPVVIQMGGIYSFYVKATELLDNELAGDETRELVTVVIRDQNDQLPKFNKPVFQLNVSEDISVGTPLPNLGMIVGDEDIGENAKFSLALKTSDIRFADSFSVEPVLVTGKSPVIIRVLDNTGLDYESGIRKIKLIVVAFVTDENGISTEAAQSEVILNIIDANDNAPEFSKSTYVLNVSEDTSVGSRIADITAYDRDSGLFSKITYSIGGFGMDKFDIDSKSDGLILIGKLDYEQQVSYSLTVDARDGGNRTASTNVLVNVIDANDNPPVFEFSEYRRNIREGSLRFQPQFFVKATDLDGASNNKITYAIVQSNSDAIDIDKSTGELIMIESASSQHTSRGQYELKIRAMDSGQPQLTSDTLVFVRVGVPGNQRPMFKGTPYNVTIPETLAPNTFITTVRATDPDGPDELLEYRITSGADNFYIKSRSGMIYLSENADLEITDSPSKKYDITVAAIDSGTPFRETAQATVTVNVLDINNKPPLFEEDNYVAHISEEAAIGSPVITVKAKDPDTDAELEYSLLKPFQIADRKGFMLKDDQQNYNDLFAIDKDTGMIKLERSLRNDIIHVVTVTVQARDKRAVENAENQYNRVEVTFFIEASDKEKPIFLTGGWTRSNAVITHNMLEEQPIGSTILKLAAQDPVMLSPINVFLAKSTLPRQLAMDPVGNVVVTERMDYETINSKTLSFQAEAVSHDGQRRSETKVVINVIDINDHAPQFQYQNYQGSIEENSKNGTIVLYVAATDGDLPTSPQGYGNISYYLIGEHAFLFEIDPKDGKIKVGNKAIIDREKQSVLNLIAVAMDTPSGGKDRKKSEVSIHIDVLDVNDNSPTFTEKVYSVVILENSVVGASVLNISATDPDIGQAGNVSYEIANELDSLGLFKIDSTFGEIIIQKPLTGRGRNYPYSLTVRALDNGEPQLFTDVPVSVFIGDVITNDGIPVFVHPTEDEVAYISEDAPIGSLVFHVVGVDPDDPFTPEGQIQYSILKDSSDVDAFNIDAKTGLISTRIKLDRESKNRYSLIILIKDGGLVPQQATRVLRVFLNDTNDNIPIFKRSVDEKPMQILVKEELPIGSIINAVEALDPDEGENANIGYLIIDSNEENIITITDSSNNTGLLQIAQRIDREQISGILLTVKCFKKKDKPKILYKKYNKTDLTERQIYVKVLDIDDNYPEFSEKNITIGVRFNIPLDSLLLTVSARDIDVEAGPITYNIFKSTFESPNLAASNFSLPFILNSVNGEIRTNASLSNFVNGYFSLQISANSGSSKNYSLNFMKIYVVRERSLLRFVFSKTPAEVKDYLTEFKTELESIVALPSVQLNIYETQFHSKQDGSLDLAKTSSCFQVIADKYGTKEAELFFKDENNNRLKDLYQKYNVQSVERCGNIFSKPSVTWVQISLLTIATFIGVTSIISSCILCCSYSRWQRLK